MLILAPQISDFINNAIKENTHNSPICYIALYLGMHIDILHEDSHCIVVNKPHNVLIHNSYYARNIREETVLDHLFATFKHKFYPVHRLDRKTSGTLLLTKDKAHISAFQQIFVGNKIQKSYIAIVRGHLEEAIYIESPVKHPETGVYKEASTLCKPLKSVELPIPIQPYKTSRYSLVELLPETGRIHQLRIHMNKISKPILGDFKYGDRFHNRMIAERFGCDNLFLHAHKINFKHPFSKEILSTEAPLSSHWNKIFGEFGWR